MRKGTEVRQTVRPRGRTMVPQSPPTRPQASHTHINGPHIAVLGHAEKDRGSGTTHYRADAHTRVRAVNL